MSFIEWQIPKKAFGKANRGESPQIGLYFVEKYKNLFEAEVK